LTTRQQSARVTRPIPDIIGVEKTTAEQICRGETEELLKQLDILGDVARDEIIIDLTCCLGTALHDLAVLLDAIETDSKLASETRESIDRISAFDNQILCRFQALV
jgi:hypothetical protein